MPTSTSSANRISKTPKACQQCRTRKSRCDGQSPCMPCQQRGQHSACHFRDFVRRRRAKTATASTSTATLSPGEPGIVEVGNSNNPLQADTVIQGQPAHDALPVYQYEQPEHNSAGISKANASTTARSRGTGMVEIYYGPTSDFSLAQHLHRDLFGTATSSAFHPESSLKPAGHGRHLFSGLPAAESALLSVQPISSNLFEEILAHIPYDLAKELLERYLQTHYAYAPFAPAEFYRGQLDEIYSAHMDVQISSSNMAQRQSQNQKQSHTRSNNKQILLLMALALAALATENWEWGETLFRRVRRDHMEDVRGGAASLESIQVQILIICSSQVYALFESEAGRPNYAYLALGNAAREAFVAGLHKEALKRSWRRGVSPVDVSARRVTFWVLYFHESWISFSTGRPSSFHGVDIETPLPDNPFLALLTGYARLMGAITDRIYKPKHSVIANLWREACILSEQLSALKAKVQDMFSVDWEDVERNSVHGAREVLLVTVFNHMTLLTYRPLIIFRARWKRDEDRLNRAQPQAQHQARSRPECTTYLRDGCNRALGAAISTIRYLSALGSHSQNQNENQSSMLMDIRTHTIYLTHAILVLLYDFIHDTTHPALHLHWIHTALRFLARMRRGEGEPVVSVVAATRGMLRRVDLRFDVDTFLETERQRHRQDQDQSPFDGFGGANADDLVWQLSTPTPGALDGGGVGLGLGSAPASVNRAFDSNGIGSAYPLGTGEGEGCLLDVSGMDQEGDCDWGAALDLNQDLASLDMDAFFTFPFDDFLVQGDEGFELGLDL
ncbi:hypothetical protein BDW74DRAFT_180853 [Aspergillus multicolor]|uniref:uncharacterized protein n=1 Tax=Aspergillus multicolor TaxID=41759 RepID=UPI003CCE1DD8